MTRLFRTPKIIWVSLGMLCFVSLFNNVWSGVMMKDKEEFRLSHCGKHDDFFGVSFTNADKSSSGRFAIYPDKKLLKVSLPNRKGLAKWELVKSIDINWLDENEGLITIEFTEKFGFLSEDLVSSLKFGIVDKSCWSELKDFVGDAILMNEMRQSMGSGSIDPEN